MLWKEEGNVNICTLVRSTGKKGRGGMNTYLKN